ncbi:MAG: radical SAM protein [Lachnospiraceae bacterium]|nr:radical SAM protein [Lachnospiraceae bacterium]
MEENEIMQRYHYIKYMNSMKRPMSVTLDITNRCNMRCSHCFNRSGDSTVYNFDNELTKEELIDVVQQIAELMPTQCCICGGEPLLNRNVFEVIRILSEKGIMVNMVSNGLLLTKEVAQNLKNAGISNVQISVDGLGYQHDLFRNMDGAFDKAILAIENLKNANIETLVSCCPNQLNFRTIHTYIEFMIQLSCKTIRMMPLLPLGRGNKNFDRLLMNSKETFWFVQQVNNEQSRHPNINIEWGDPLEHIFLVLFNKRKYPIILGIMSNGNINVTPYLPIVVGNIREKSLKQYWEEGYNKIWGNKEIMSVIKGVKSVYDLRKFEDQSFYFNI